jgi:regulator of replication initiation timing
MIVRWVLRRFRFVQDIEWELQVRQRAFESAARYATQLEILKEHLEARIKDLTVENAELRAENEALKEALEGRG